MSHVLLPWASHLYVFASALYAAYFVRAHRALALSALTAVSLGFVLQTCDLVQRFLAYGYTPVTNLGESLALLGWILAGASIVVQRRYRLPTLGAFALPLVAMVVLPAALLQGASRPVPEALKRAGLPVHVLVAFGGIALFALAAGVAVAYLLLERQMKGKHFGVVFSRLPSLETLDRICDHLMRWGFVALSVTLITGAYFAKKTWGDYWSWDPKQTLSLISWFLFAGLLQARLFAGWRGRRAAVLTMVGFAVLLVSFLGLRLFPAGLHSGDFQ